MNKSYRYIALYITFAIILATFYYPIDIFSQKSIDLQKNILIKQAQTHFYDQVNTRKWNAQYNGVYVKPQKNQKPNPYLKNNTLYVDKNLTLIKINPAWMTRQFSELSTIKDFHFRITSLNPLNPNNRANNFEKRALKKFSDSKIREYYEVNIDNTFNYMGALETTQSCLACHQHQGYQLGDVRGGISINLDSSEYWKVSSSVKNQALIMKIVVTIFLLSILLLIRRQFQANEILQTKVTERTQEIQATKQLLQVALDADPSLLMIADGLDIILVNKSLLKFFQVKDLEDFKKEYKYISSSFEIVDDKDFLTQYINDEHWISYLQRKQKDKNLKVLIKRNGGDVYFRLHSEETISNNKVLHTIIFDDITYEHEKITVLEERASKDPLTKLFNRSSFDNILSQEIRHSSTTNTPLSIIFLDIDFFKKVNDTFGHDIGDSVLIELSELLIKNTREQDFVARWGGEEFIIILQSTNANQAFKVAQKIRVAVESNTFKGAGKVTISLGLSQYQDDESKKVLLKRLDKALYEAKANGRNQVVLK